jgi:hypothetical protein
MRLLDADAIAVYSMWFKENGEPRDLVVGITRRDKRRGDARQLLEVRKLETEVRAAFAAAIAAAELTDLVTVRIASEPAGAEISIDRRLSGTTPADFQLTPGEHEIRAAKQGHVSLFDYFEVPAGAPTHDYRITLPPEPAAAAPNAHGSGVSATLGPRPPEHAAAASDDRTASAADYAVGGALALSGVLLTLTPIHTLLTQDDCADASCSRIYKFSTESALQGAAGLALIGGGLAVALWIQPFAVRVSVGERTAIAAQTRF